MSEQTLDELRVAYDTLNAEKQKVDELNVRLRAELEKPVRCLRCGYDTANKAPKVDTDILHQYYTAVLGQQPFRFTYSMLNGILRVTCESQSGMDVLEVDAQTSAEKALRKIEDTLTVSCVSMVELYNVDGSLNRVHYEANDAERSAALKNVDQQMIKLCAGLDRGLIAQVRKAAGLFMTLQSRLAVEGQDENFYKGVGLY